jgi:uncharacterized protein with von Willebrand factor type A (vWA) domain
MMAEPYPLEGLFMTLRRRGLPLGWRDYEDALKVLSGGVGVGRRHDLLRVLQLLWTRTDSERRTLDQVFGQIALPTPEEIESYRSLNQLTRGLGEGSTETQRNFGDSVAGDGREEPVALNFVGTEARGMAIPKPVFPPMSEEAFVLTPQSAVTLRSLIIVWRRFQKRLREGPAVDLDVEGSIEQQCRGGRLLAPVLRPERRNRARLVLLIDVSPSMAAWSLLMPAWEESMAQSQLGSASIYYFSNVPGEVLYRNRWLREPVELEETLRADTNSAVLIFSDGGAARGNRDRQRIQRTREFLKQIGSQWSPLVWINPMPEPRWKGSTAAWLAQQPKLHMLPLGDTSMVRAIDLLRGARTA